MVVICNGCDAKRGPPPKLSDSAPRKPGDVYGPWGYCRACTGWVKAEGRYCPCCGGRVRRKPRACIVERDKRRASERAAGRAARQAETDGCSTVPAPAASALLEVPAA